MKLAPVALFVYNRPDHTRKVVEALLRNPLAANSDLLIFSDGPRSEGDRRKVGEVRKYLAEITGFQSVMVSEAAENRGLAKAIIAGVTRVINEYGKVIVLEDDLVVSPHFLSFMNKALVHYADVERVMHISGYWYPVDHKGIPETFFLRVPSSWGWATWARAWRWLEKHPQELKRAFTRADIRRFNLEGANDFWEQVVHNLNGKADTWAIFWYAAIFRRDGLCLYPSRSLVQNIGTDGTGVHCLITDIYRGELAGSGVSGFRDIYEEDLLALGHLQEFYRKNRIGRLRRFLEIARIRAGRMLTGGM